MNLTNLLDYTNSIYNLFGEINTIKRHNVNAKTKSSTSLKMLFCGIVTGNDSVNDIQHMTIKDKVKKSLFAKGEYIPKMHGFRDSINDISSQDIINIHKNMLLKMKNNKVFDNHTYRNTKVAIVDGIENFETHKEIDGLHIRERSNDNICYYYKSLGISFLTDSFNLMIDLVPFEKHEIKDDKDKNEKVKSEGEITVLKRSIPLLTEYNIEVAVMDAMFLNAPCLNAIKSASIDAIIRLKDERRTIYKDAKGLFESSNPIKEYEIVEISERKKVTYSKESKKKNTDETTTYTITREISNATLNESKVIENKIVEHPKKIVKKEIKEKVIKRIKIWTDIFQLDGYEYNNGCVRVIKTEETTRDGKGVHTKDMYLVSTNIDEDIEFVIDLMHKRWTIELNCFRTLKSRYHLDHLFIGTRNAIELITYFIMIIFNIIELYFNVHTRKYKRKINFKHLLQDFKDELLNSKNMYLLFKT